MRQVSFTVLLPKQKETQPKVVWITVYWSYRRPLSKTYSKPKCCGQDSFSYSSFCLYVLVSGSWDFLVPGIIYPGLRLSRRKEPFLDGLPPRSWDDLTGCLSAVDNFSLEWWWFKDLSWTCLIEGKEKWEWMINQMVTVELELSFSSLFINRGPYRSHDPSSHCALVWL